MPTLRVLILYHYFYPDNVVSAQHFSQLAEELQSRHWQVIAMPSNRGCRNESKRFKLYENWKRIEIRRIWRPRFRQSSTIGRVLNATWMISAWCIIAFKKSVAADVLVIGTDPVLSVLVGLFWKKIRPTVRIVHWCFDVYPEAAIAGGLFKPNSIVVRVLRRLLRHAYKACDLIVDIGSCMRTKLKVYESQANRATLIPWALAEPKDVPEMSPVERKMIFGSAKLGLMYSGNFGRVHSSGLILDLMRCLRGQSIKMAFSVRGNCVDQLRAAVLPTDKNISFVPFAPQDKLQVRLSAADIHIVTQRQDFVGTFVPSKFFGALAVGRPVIFAGSPESAVAKWITTYKVGWVLQPETLSNIAEEMKELANSKEKVNSLAEHCHQIYQEFFCKKRTTDKWDVELRRLLNNGYTAE